MEPATLSLPPWLWGAATSAFQVEGSPLADGAGPSNWYVFTHTPGKVRGGHTADVACDHYRRFPEDVGLMRQLGLQAYRFSLAWGRILPEGRGRINTRGLDFYQRLVDHLLEAGVQPMVTLFHWDLPWELERQGGWANPATVEAFAHYGQVVFRALGDRVRLWATLNEPWVVMDAGYVHGVHPPGRREPAVAVRVAHHLLLAHARAVQVGRAQGVGAVGLVVNLEPKQPGGEREEDRQAAQRAHTYNNRLFLDPLFFGRYPEDVEEAFGTPWPEELCCQVEQVRRSLDFLGINYYTRSVLVHDPQAPPPKVRRLPPPAEASTTMGWEIYPQGLGETLHWVAHQYPKVPLLVTENGAAFADPPPGGGRVADQRRVRFLREHIQQVLAARAQGVDVRGYFLWSLLDNFEWTEGYFQRFGVVYVDFATQQRTIKDSGWFYRQVIASDGRLLQHPFTFPSGD
ncbi:MAG: GH1 family beta-glucosidase [Thermoanaerobaculum sp.]|nr:GH1 family beta-glucosidase [Thermoanaerobaculum sp.]